MDGQNEAYEKILTANLQRAIDFLRFAEAKNAAMLALASAWVVAGLNLESGSGSHKITGLLSLCLPLAMLSSLCAGILALISFLPRLHLPTFLGGKRAGPHAKNFLYFGDIRSLTPKSLKQEIHTRYYPDANGHRKEYLSDLVVQISVNSDIATRKMLLFRSGVCFILAACFSLLAPILLTATKAIEDLW
jgi:hypothetical protein